MSKKYTEAEVAQHNKENDCWVVLGNNENGGAKVYDVTKYLNDHPGGPEIILEYAGKNADAFFEDIGHSKEARNKMKNFVIGDAEVSATPSSKTAADVKSKGGLSPMAVFALLVAIAVGLYFLNQKH